MSFLNDLRVGKDAQEALKQKLLILGFANISENNDIAYDLLADEIKIEVKFDKYEERSGNIAIEFFNTKSNKPSGITATKADLWCHILQKDGSYLIYLTSTVKLKDFIEKNKPFRIIESGGDGNASLLLFKTDIIIPAIFTLLESCTTKNELLNV
jgi:hypothetical protein